MTHRRKNESEEAYKKRMRRINQNSHARYRRKQARSRYYTAAGEFVGPTLPRNENGVEWKYREFEPDYAYSQWGKN